uniref:PaRXLR45 n=1 Tax=Phytophthora agathidicida TaxID=1642459 RepID=A0A7G4WI34_9STRA|nr:PaRXLR45 [Phytophthora agathidicida]
MRLSHVLVAIAAIFLAASNALKTTDSNQISDAASPTGHKQRFLRVDPTIIEDDDYSEERALSESKMKSMIKKLMTKEDYAAKLGISQKLDELTNVNGAGLARFMQTAEYQKYIGYVNYLNDMAKNGNEKYKNLVQQIKDKSPRISYG